MRTITLDTNCINTKLGLKAINKLEEWHKQGRVEIVKTDVMDTELMSAESPSFREKALKKSASYHEDVGNGVWGDSRWGHFLWGRKSDEFPLEKIRDLLFPQYNKLDEKGRKQADRDLMHLETHKKYDRDVFVTEDKHFLDKKDVLNEQFGIRVLNPKKLVEEIVDGNSENSEYSGK